MRDLTSFKNEVRSKWPDSTLAKVLEVEPDTMSDSDFLAKMPTWLKLAKEPMK